MGRRSDHSREELRELALQAAENIVDTQGVAGFSTRKVASAMGYTAGSLYLIFENLDELLLNVNARTLDSLFTALYSAQTHADLPQNHLNAMGHAYLAFALQHQHRWRMIFEYQPSADNVLPVWYQDKISRPFTLVEKHLQALLPTVEAAQCAQFARALWGGVHGICILAVTDKLATVGVVSVQQLLDTLIDSYLAGIQQGSE